MRYICILGGCACLWAKRRGYMRLYNALRHTVRAGVLSPIKFLDHLVFGH